MKWISLFGVCSCIFASGLALKDNNWYAMAAWIIAALWAFNCFYKDLIAEKKTNSITDNN